MSNTRVANHAFGDRELKNVIRTSESNLLSYLKGSDVYDPDRIEADRDLLRRFYLRKGYADAEVVAAAAEYDPVRKVSVITFTVEEGDLYRFGSIDVISNVKEVPGVRQREVNTAWAKSWSQFGQSAEVDSAPLIP